jgi:hypothetical protein
MTDRLRRLTMIADLMRDRALMDLRHAAEARAASRQHLERLNPAPVAVVDDPADWRNAVMHQAWADARRAEINLMLARQTAAWIEARHAAARAVGRARVLDKLRDG